MKEILLKTIEDLMNDIVDDYKNSLRPGQSNFLIEYFNDNYPNIIWTWNNNKIVVTDFIQKEI